MNELTLCIVNEGADYQERLSTARLAKHRHRFFRWCRRVELEAGRQEREFDHEPFTVVQMAQAAVELDDYYQRRLAETKA